MSIELRSALMFAAFAAGIMLLGPVFQAQTRQQLAASNYILPEADRVELAANGEPAGLQPFDPKLTARMALEETPPTFKERVIEASSRNAFILMSSLQPANR